MPKKTKYKIPKKKTIKLSTFQSLILLLPIVLFLVLLVLLAGLFLWKADLDQVQMPKSLTNKEYNYGKEYPITSWNTYTNNKLGFSIKYPKLGYIQNPKCFENGTCNGEVLFSTCENGITEQNLTRSSNLITLGNMLGVIVNNYNGSINTFIKSQGGNPNDFALTNQKRKGADEAYLATIDKNSMTPPIPSILTPAYLIRKGDNIYQIAPVQNFGSKAGCLPPAGTKANSFKSLYWNIPKSITIN